VRAILAARESLGGIAHPGLQIGAAPADEYEKAIPPRRVESPADRVNAESARLFQVTFMILSGEHCRQAIKRHYLFFQG
jgi:hypothetical protein